MIKCYIVTEEGIGNEFIPHVDNIINVTYPLFKVYRHYRHVGIRVTDMMITATQMAWYFLLLEKKEEEREKKDANGDVSL